MKINPGSHIVTTDNEQVTQSHLQLAYFKEAEKNASLKVTLYDDIIRLKQMNKKAVYPFQRFETDKILFFSSIREDAETIRGIDCIKKGNDYYYYEPKNSVEYVPPSFTYSVLIKKAAEFKPTINYNISIRCYNDAVNTYAENLISIFSSACADKPSNIFFNNNQDTYYSLITEDNDSSNQRLDFLVLSYDDFKNSKEEILERLDRHTNLWILDSDYDGALKHVYTGTVEVSDIKADTSGEFPLITGNYITNSSDIRVWIDDIELAKGIDFFEAKYDENDSLVKIEEKDGPIMSNVVILKYLSKEALGREISYYIESSDEIISNLQDPVIYKGKKIIYPLANEKKAFDTKLFEQVAEAICPDGSYEIEQLFEGVYQPMLLLHKPGAGYIFFSDEEVVRNVYAFREIVLESIMNIYLKSYFETSKRTEYIADEKIDYIYNLNNRLNLAHRRIDTQNLLYADGYNMNIEYEPLFEVICDDTVVNVTNAFSNELSFRRKSKICPEKKDNEVSLFTVNNTVMNLDKENCVIYILEEVPEISDISSEGRLGIKVKPLRSSCNEINILGETNLYTDTGGDTFLLNVSYTLYHDNDLKKILAVKSEQFSGTNKTKLAEITFKSDTKIEIGDIRQYGGGESSANKNYEMIDSSSLKGRPLRIGSAFIIKMPLRFSKYRDILESEIKKHIASGDYPMLVFTNE